ncbi:hypothetical protein C8Q79DRAFT_955056 [Trametes meyenii]|nr:hypothetical protein C8Q79DRAFT_955056 [Trametes meyenii]
MSSLRARCPPEGEGAGFSTVFMSDDLRRYGGVPICIVPLRSLEGTLPSKPFRSSSVI